MICGIEHRQHNLPESFLKYIEEAIERYSAAGRNLYIKINKMKDLKNFQLKLSFVCSFPRYILFFFLHCFDLFFS